MFGIKSQVCCTGLVVRLVGRGFKERVHRIAYLSETPLRYHKALLAANPDQVRLDGGPHNSSGLVFTLGVVNARDEPAKRQRLLLVIDFYGMSIGRETARALWGAYVAWKFVAICCLLTSRLRANRLSILWLAARRQGCAFGLHLIRSLRQSRMAIKGQ
jgi:hypothetical protein